MTSTTQDFTLANHQDMNTRHAIFLCKAKHIHIFHGIVRYILLLLYSSNRLDLITESRSLLKAELTACCVHLLDKRFKH